MRRFFAFKINIQRVCCVPKPHAMSFKMFESPNICFKTKFVTSNSHIQFRFVGRLHNWDELNLIMIYAVDNSISLID